VVTASDITRDWSDVIRSSGDFCPVRFSKFSKSTSASSSNTCSNKEPANWADVLSSAPLLAAGIITTSSARSMSGEVARPEMAITRPPNSRAPRATWRTDSVRPEADATISVSPLSNAGVVQSLTKWTTRPACTRRIPNMRKTDRSVQHRTRKCDLPGPTRGSLPPNALRQRQQDIVGSLEMFQP